MEVPAVLVLDIVWGRPVLCLCFGSVLDGGEVKVASLYIGWATSSPLSLSTFVSARVARFVYACCVNTDIPNAVFNVFGSWVPHKIPQF